MNLKKKISVILTGILLGMNILSVNCFADYTVQNITVKATYENDRKNLKSVELTGYLKNFEEKHISLYAKIKNYLDKEINFISEKISSRKSYRDDMLKLCRKARKDLDALNFEPNSYEFNIKNNLHKQINNTIKSINDSIQDLRNLRDIMVAIYRNQNQLTLVFNKDNYKGSLSEVYNYFYGSSSYSIDSNRYTIKMSFPRHLEIEHKKSIDDYMTEFTILLDKFKLDSISDLYILVQADKINQLQKEQNMPAYIKEIKQNVDEYTKKIKQDLITHNFKESFK